MWNKFTLGQKVTRYPSAIYFTEKQKMDNHSVIIKIRLKMSNKPFVRYQYKIADWSSWQKPGGGYLNNNIWHEEYNLYPLESSDPNDILKALVLDI